jgi:hypothetical protein
MVRAVSALPANDFAIGSLTLNGADYVFLNGTAVPEPSSMILVTIGVAGLILGARLRYRG